MMASSRMAKLVLVNRHNATRPFTRIGGMRCAARFSDTSNSSHYTLYARPIATSTSKVSSRTIPTAASTAVHHHTIETGQNQLPQKAETALPSPFSKIDFTNSASAHGSKSTLQLLRALAVFQTCRIPFVVRHAESLLKLSTAVLGTTLSNEVVKHTFFGHFCAGEHSAGMMPVIEMLQENNIGPILDYAAESDEGDDKDAGDVNMAGDNVEGVFTQPPFNQPARVYDYKSECECDKHVEIFKSCIQSVRDVSPHGFAALKVTALGNPELLQRMSTMIVEIKNLFSKFDEKGTGLIGRDEFVRCYEHYFHADNKKLAEILEMLDPSNTTGMIDYISFSQMFTPYTLPTFTLKCKDIGPLALATPSDEEVVLMKKMSERLHTLAEEAALCGTRLLIDAEHQKYQPAIDNLVLELQQKYNAKDRTKRPVIFNTYQCYLKDTPERIATDLGRSERFGFHFAAKLVRGAYMVHERERAKKMNISDPIHDSAQNTHQCYDSSIETLLNHRFQHGPGLEIMIATHNKTSIENAVHLMSKLGLNPNDESVHFAQLFGMCDNLTFTLGNSGYNAFKYLPYGEVDEVIPYLVRRAQENGDVMGNAGEELSLLTEELKKRFSFV